MLLTKSQRKRWKLRTYARLVSVVAMLALINFVFNKLAEGLYNKYDIGTILGLGALFIIFIFVFTVMLWAVDTKSTIGRILGAKDEEPTRVISADNVRAILDVC